MYYLCFQMMVLELFLPQNEQDRWMMRRKNKEEEEAKKKDPEEENAGDFKPSEFKITDRDDIKQEMDDDDDQPKQKSNKIDG